MAGWLWAVAPDRYAVYVKTQTFALRQVGRAALEQVRPGDVIFAYLTGSKVIAGMFEAVGEAFYDTTALVAGGAYPHRLRVRALATLSEEAWVPYEAFRDKLDVVGDYPNFRALVQRVLHPLPRVDEKVLEFLVRARQAADLETVLAAYDAYLKARSAQDVDAPQARETPAPYPNEPFDRNHAIADLITYIAAQGFVYEPWQVAAYVAALRTKPFVILAGVTGTGKSKLPALVEAGTGGLARLIPVRPDWADSAEVLGYLDLQGAFRPGAVLSAVREAQERPARHLTCILDEMNLARVEQYFAEILSRIEDRQAAAQGGYQSPPLLTLPVPAGDEGWAAVSLPPNLAFVGTVNMDESAHGFSRKVLDRAFTLELADVDLSTWQRSDTPAPAPTPWPVAAWHPLAVSLAGLTDPTPEAEVAIQAIIENLEALNRFLTPAQVQVAYRTRDEIALFVLHAQEIATAFRTRTGEAVDPLDLALHMKVLPRLVGGSRPLHRALLGLLGWTLTGVGFEDDAEARATLATWQDAGRPAALHPARFPRTAARLCLMVERLLADGFTSYWL